MNADEPTTVNYYKVNEFITVKVCIYKPGKTTFELQYWNDWTNKRLLYLDENEANWLASYNPQKSGNCNTVIANYRPEVKLLALWKKERINDAVDVTYWGACTTVDLKKFTEIFNGVMKDVNIISPHIWNNVAICNKKDDVAMLKQLLIVLTKWHYEKACMEKCYVCYASSDLFYVNDEMCKFCKDGYSNEENQCSHTEKCLANNIFKREKIVRKALKKIEPYQLAFALHENKIKNDYLHFTCMLKAQCLSIDNIIGNSLEFIVKTIANDKCYYPLSSELMRKARLPLIPEAYDQTCKKCGLKYMAVFVHNDKDVF